jgi:hypothetical protein
MLWADGRQTERGEWFVYSLFGIFDIQLLILYSEGRQKAMKRLRREIEDLPATKSLAPLSKVNNRLQVKHSYKPCSSVSFSSDSDFVNLPGILAWVHNILAKNASRAAFVGLGGKGSVFSHSPAFLSQKFSQD